MRGKSLVLLLLALGCGLVASIGITQVMAKRTKGPAIAPGDAETIFVAMEDIGFGEPLSAHMLRLEQWPKGKVPPGALTRIEDVEGRRTRTRLYAGEPILDNKLFGKGASEQGYTTLIPKGYRVVSVKVDKVTGGSGLILPGDRVDVLVHLVHCPSRGIHETTTRTILQDVKVFAVNDMVETNDRDEKSITATTISLLVTPDHAEKIMLATELGKIRLIMRSPHDDEIATVDGSTAHELFHGFNATDRKHENPPAEPNVAQGKGAGFLDFLSQMRVKGTADQPNLSKPYQPERHQMRLVKGDEVIDVVLESAGDPSQPDSKVWRLSASEVAPVFNPTGTPPAEEKTEEEEEDEEEDIKQD